MVPHVDFNWFSSLWGTLLQRGFMPIKLIVYPNNTWTGNKVCLPVAYALQTVMWVTSLHIKWNLLKTELPLSQSLFFIQGKKGYMVPCFPRVVCLSLTTYQDLDHISWENKTQGPNSESGPPQQRGQAQHWGSLIGKRFLFMETESQRREEACPGNYGLNSHKAR